MNRQITDSELAADASGWERTPVWEFGSDSGYLGDPRRVGQAFGARYTTVQHHLDVYVYVVVHSFGDGSHSYSVARMFELRELHRSGSVSIEIPESWFAEDLQLTYPGKIDCDSAIVPFEKAHELALADFRLDPWFPRIISLTKPQEAETAE